QPFSGIHGRRFRTMLDVRLRPLPDPEIVARFDVPGTVRERPLQLRDGRIAAVTEANSSLCIADPARPNSDPIVVSLQEFTNGAPTQLKSGEIMLSSGTYILLVDPELPERRPKKLPKGGRVESWRTPLELRDGRIAFGGKKLHVV